MNHWIQPTPYHISEVNLREDRDTLEYWCRNLGEHTRLLDGIRESYPDAEESRVQGFWEAYVAAMKSEALLSRYAGRFDMYDLVELRRDLEIEFGFHDPYRAMKRVSNRAALEMLPGVLAELDAAGEAERVELLARGLMAGNMFDVGSEEAMQHHGRHKRDFAAARAAVRPRPWWRDDVDAWFERARGGGYRRVGWFVDNCGADIGLGVLPLARWLLGEGSEVVLLANEGPALNDILAPELGALLEEVADLDGALAAAWRAGRLQVLSNGNDCPLLDLRRIPAEASEQLAGADLLVLHGMGRGVESNYDARFRCDVLRTAVVKDPWVAQQVGCERFDCQFRLEPGEV